MGTKRKKNAARGRVRFRWHREIANELHTGGTLVVLRGGDGRPYINLEVGDPDFDGVIEGDDVRALVATLRRMGA